MKRNNVASILLLFSIQLQKILDAGRPKYDPESDPTLIPYDIIDPDSPPYAKIFRANSLNIKPHPETIVLSNFPPLREKGIHHPLFNAHADARGYFSAPRLAKNYKSAPAFQSEDILLRDFLTQPHWEHSGRFSRKHSNARQYRADVQDSYRDSEVSFSAIRNRNVSFRGDNFKQHLGHRYAYGPSEPTSTRMLNIPGEVNIDYSVYSFPPVTSFDCEKMPHTPGMYADVEAGCQVYHVCYDGADGKTRATFLCANGTLFNQLEFICDWWYNVDCNEAVNYYGSNLDAHKNPFLMARTKKEIFSEK